MEFQVSAESQNVSETKVRRLQACKKKN